MGGSAAHAAIMFADSVLPDEVNPAAAPTDLENRSVLLTGATGFLGAHLLAVLMNCDGVLVNCLVRNADKREPRQRLQQILADFGLTGEVPIERVRFFAGDISQPRLGLSEAAFDGLCSSTDAVYHCAASVSWTVSYEALRRVNVLPVLELLRLACRFRNKPFHFISSATVCYSTRKPARISEAEDSFSLLSGLHLGYAESKCVAERLVCQASERGLPVTIFRPSLITGSSRSGIANATDILSRMLCGCIQMGCAPDLDIEIDYCPVDYVASAIAELSQIDSQRLRIFHLLNPQPRHWRELVLWLNLFGYDVELISHDAWLAELVIATRDPSHPLWPLRTFFFRRLADMDQLTLLEIYANNRTSKPRSELTHSALAKLELPCPVIDARLMEDYVCSLARRGYLPHARQRGAVSNNADGLGVEFFVPVLRNALGDDAISVLQVEPGQQSFDHGIMTALVSSKFGAQIGLRSYTVTASGSDCISRRFEFVVKIKPKAEEVRATIGEVAALCSRRLGRAYASSAQMPGFDGNEDREAAIYNQCDPRFTSHAPICYGVVRALTPQRSILVLEKLLDVDLMDSADDTSAWQPEHIASAIRGIAEFHGIWYGRTNALLHQSWLGPTYSLECMQSLTELWEALAQHARGYFVEWIGDKVASIQRAFVDSIDSWWPLLESQPQTLIHNDFNPRNIAFRKSPSGPQMCAYDWDFATLGAPQHDLAELLCFVLSPGGVCDSARQYIELHRFELEQVTGNSIDPAQWNLGFQLALRDLFINRLPMYTVIHKFRRQAFLQRVVRTWKELYGLSQYGLGPRF